VIAVLQQNYHNIAALEPLAEREARLPWLGIVAGAVQQPRWAAEHDRLAHHEVAFAVFQKPEPVGMPVEILFWRQRDFTGRHNPAEADPASILPSLELSENLPAAPIPSWLFRVG
jgi:hypothetical protein